MKTSKLIWHVRKQKIRTALRVLAAGLPIGAIVWASSLSLQSWMQQMLILFTLIWLQIFFLFDWFVFHS